METEPSSPKPEKPFKRGGFQEDGTYIQQISRMTTLPDGSKAWRPPEPNQIIATQKGPYRVERVLGTILKDGRRYFQAIVEPIEKVNE